jgi:hypothetical protein
VLNYKAEAVILKDSSKKAKVAIFGRSEQNLADQIVTPGIYELDLDEE